MYRIRGSDGREYGPVTVDQVRAWIVERRANQDTLVQAEGSAEWKPLGTFAEFADLFAAQALPPIQGAARMDKQAAEALAQEIIARAPRIDIGSCFRRAWALLKSDFWPMVGVTALVTIILMVAGSAWVGILLNGPLLGGLYWYYLKKIRGEPAELADAFTGFSRNFVQLLLLSLVSGVLLMVGLALCVVPGIYLYVVWVFALPLAIERNMEFWDALEVSRKVAHQCWFPLFGLVVVGLLLELLGALLCCVGFFVALPVAMLAITYAYEDLFGPAPKTA